MAALPFLKDLLSYNLGCAVNADHLCHTPGYRDLVINEFSSLTPENDLKLRYLRPTEADFDFSRTDLLLEFAARHNKRLHGHTLVWHEDLPEWVLNFKGDYEDWDKLLAKHIKTVVSRYAGKINSWDVVNEAFDETGKPTPSIWFKNLGFSYIEKAFQYAHEADPGCLLFYNDYNLGVNDVKRKSVIKLVTGLRNKGIPINGIGMQMHLDTRANVAEQTEAAFTELSEQDLLIHLSEVDVSVNPDNKPVTGVTELLALQAQILVDLFAAYNKVPGHLKHGITFWGVTDKYNWISDYLQREDHPLLFDAGLQAKPAYQSLHAYFSTNKTS